MRVGEYITVTEEGTILLLQFVNVVCVLDVLYVIITRVRREETLFTSRGLRQNVTEVDGTVWGTHKSVCGVRSRLRFVPPSVTDFTIPTRSTRSLLYRCSTLRDNPCLGCRGGRVHVYLRTGSYN